MYILSGEGCVLPRILHAREEELEFKEALLYVGDGIFVQRVKALQLCLYPGQLTFQFLPALTLLPVFFSVVLKLLSERQKKQIHIDFQLCH